MTDADLGEVVGRLTDPDTLAFLRQIERFMEAEYLHAKAIAEHMDKGGPQMQDWSSSRDDVDLAHADLMTWPAITAGLLVQTLTQAADLLQAAEERQRALETEVLDAALSDRLDMDAGGSPLTWKEVALRAESDGAKWRDAAQLRQDRALTAEAENARLRAALGEKRVWHRSWRGDRFGTVVGEYTTNQGHQYCWVVGPHKNDRRPLTYMRASLTFVDEEAALHPTGDSQQGGDALLQDLET